MNFPTIDKQDYTVYKEVKHFRPYLLKVYMIVYVPHLAVKTLFLQHDMGEKREN